MGFERKFAKGDPPRLTEGVRLDGYASFFNELDSGGDIVVPGAFASGLRAARAERRSIKMLWQHDPSRVIGVWDEVYEDDRGLRVSGRLLADVAAGREAAALVEAGALDGLSIGYSVRRATRDEAGRRLLRDVELWEVSLVTFPMLATARVGAKSQDLGAVVRALHALRGEIAGRDVPAHDGGRHD